MGSLSICLSGANGIFQKLLQLFRAFVPAGRWRPPGLRSVKPLGGLGLRWVNQLNFDGRALDLNQILTNLFKIQSKIRFSFTKSFRNLISNQQNSIYGPIYLVLFLRLDLDAQVLRVHLVLGPVLLRFTRAVLGTVVGLGRAVGLGALDRQQGYQMAKFDPFLSLECARVEGVGA